MTQQCLSAAEMSHNTSLRDGRCCFMLGCFLGDCSAYSQGVACLKVTEIDCDMSRSKNSHNIYLPTIHLYWKNKLHSSNTRMVVSTEINYLPSLLVQ